MRGSFSAHVGAQGAVGATTGAASDPDHLGPDRWRVAQPSAALLFVVPLYLNAALQPSVKGASCNGTHFQVLLDATAAAVAATEQYARHDGADHVIVSNSWKLTQTPPEQAPWSKVGQLPNELFRRTFRNAIVGLIERATPSQRAVNGVPSPLRP